MKRLLVALAVIIPFLVSCPTENPFADIEGINLLSEEEQAFTGWEIDYGDDDGEFEYMSFEEETSETGPDTEDTVRRVEIVNLVPNGDFSSATLLTGWSEQNFDTSTSAVNEGKLSYNIKTATEYIQYDLENLNDTLIPGASYIIRFDLKSDSDTSYFEYHGTNTMNWVLPTTDDTIIYQFPADPVFSDVTNSTFSPSAVQNYFIIGDDTPTGGGAMEGYIDNLRVARTDIDSCVALDVPKANLAGTSLPSGFYRFTIYVKIDPDVTPDTPNRMPASAVSLSLVSAEGASVSQGSYATFEATDDWSDWTAFSVTGFIQVDDDAETALRLRISPTDTSLGANNRDVGSLLISSPILEYSANGTF